MAPQQRTNVSRHGTVETCYPPERAIWLFSAEGERLWLGDHGWDPAILRGDGFSEADIFVAGETIFVTVAFDAARGLAEYARVKPGVSAGLVRVRVEGNGTGSVARVSYRMTSLGDAGDADLSAMTEAAFAAEMKDWEHAIAANAQSIETWLSAKD